MIVTISSNDVINWNAKTEAEKKVAEIANIIQTRKGEIPFMREVGISDEFIDKPITVIKPVITNEINAAINENIENVSIQNVEVLAGASVGDYLIKVVCEI